MLLADIISNNDPDDAYRLLGDNYITCRDLPNDAMILLGNKRITCSNPSIFVQRGGIWVIKFPTTKILSPHSFFW